MKQLYLKISRELLTGRLRHKVSGRAFRCVTAILCALLVPAALFAQAPSISYTSPQTFVAGAAITALSPTASGVAALNYSSKPAIFGSNFKSPGGIAIDNAGNVYVANQTPSSIVEYPVGGGAPDTLGSGFNFPTDVAVDAAGNVYVADGGSGSIKEIFPGNSSVLTIRSGFSFPSAIALDAANNIYFSDGNNTIYKFPAGSPNPVAVASGFNGPFGMAVDAAGNIYVTDSSNSLFKVPAGGGATVTINKNLNNPNGVRVDAAGDIYVADSGNGLVKVFHGGTFTPLSFKFGFPFGMAIAARGALYVSDDNTNSVYKFQPVGGYFISPALPKGLTFNSATGVISGTPVDASPATIYSVTAYNASGSSTTTVKITVTLPPLPTLSYVSPKTYTLGAANAALSPTASGVATLAYSDAPVNFASGFHPGAIALDAEGNVYVPNQFNGKIQVIPANGGPADSLGSGFSSANDVAVDAAGNVYVADGGNGAIKEIPLGNGPVITLASGVGFPAAIALDAANNIYFADGNSSIQKIPVGGGTPVVVASGFNGPFGVALDAAGDIYVTDSSNSLFKVPAGGGATQTIYTGLNNPNGVRVDAAGDVYVADSGSGFIKVFQQGSTTPTTLSYRYEFPFGMAIDPAGILYVADQDNNTITKLKPAGGYFISGVLPAGLSFNSKNGIISGTPVTPSAAANYTVTAYNVAGAASATVTITVKLPPLPTLSYAGPKTYILGTAIPALAPTASGVAALAYSLVKANFTSGFEPSGIALDATGNLYVPVQNKGQVIEFPVGGGAADTLASGFNFPSDVAVDAAGNVYVADAGNGAIKEILAGSQTVVTLASGVGFPAAIALDAANNIYFADGNSAIFKIPAGGGAAVSVATGFNSPFGMAIDATGNIYVTDFSNGLYKVPAGGGATVTLYTGLNNPNGLRVDAAGDVYVADSGNGLVKVFPAGSGTPITLSYKFTFPFGLAIDPVGNIYVADDGPNVIEKLRPVGGYFLSAPLPAGLNFNIKNGIVSGTPAVLSPATNYTVNAYSFAGAATANVNIRVLNAATLSNLIISKGALSPAFDAGTINYTDGVANGVPSVTVTPTASIAAASITVNGTAVTSGTASAAIPLSVGPNTINIAVTAPDGVTTKTYTVVVTEAPSANANLLSLKPGTGAISPAFSAATTSYTETVNFAVSSITITPATTVSASTITVNGTAVASGNTSGPVALSVGTNTITTVVTAQDGVTTKTYTLTVTRSPASANASLAGLALSKGTLSPTFSSTTNSYTVAVANAVTSITVTPKTADPNATVTVNGTAVSSGTASAPIALKVGANVIAVVVTAQDGTTTNTYTLTVNRPGATNDNLSALTLSQGTLSPAFVSTTGSYTASVANSVTSLTVTPTTSDPDATVTVNGTAVTSGSPSGAIALSVGPNTITVAVTASNGTTTKTYTIIVSRTGSANANLSAYKISRGTLTPVFATTTTSYTASVANGVASMTVTPTVADLTATITVNGSAVASGSASQTLPLVAGTNTITTVVTAQDGVTIKTYTLVVTEAKSTNDNLLSLKPGTGSLSPAFSATTTAYTESVDNTVNSITITPTSVVNTATIKVRGTVVQSGSPSGAIALSVGANTINTIVTAQDGVTSKTYIITITRAAPSADSFDPGISVSKPTEAPTLAEDGILVHQGVSPNGDGLNDVLQIENISQYPDNKLAIMNRNGQLIFEAKGYDNTSKVFDGHSNKNGQMQLPGTYFYQLDYTVNGIIKHKTGFIVLKY